MRKLVVVIFSIMLLTAPARGDDYRRLSVALLTDFVPGNEFIAAEIVIEKTS